MPIVENTTDAQHHQEGAEDGADDVKRPKHIPIKDMPKAKIHRVSDRSQRSAGQQADRQFNELHRPVQLDKKVFGYHAPNEWVLHSRFHKDIFRLIREHAQDKPVLVFCATRKGEPTGQPSYSSVDQVTACQKTAEEIAMSLPTVEVPVPKKTKNSTGPTKPVIKHAWQEK